MATGVTPLQQSILIVEDDAAIREMVAATLRNADYNVEECSDSESALEKIGDHLPDMILLDWMLPGLSGIEFARRLKREEITSEVPIIMLTAKGEEYDRVRGFDSGVDDYVSKPFSTRELVARIRAVLRRVQVHGGRDPIDIDGLRLDPASHRVVAHDRRIKLGPTEFRLLRFFMSHPERVFDRAQLLDRVWGRNIYIEERTVDVHIRRLRKALAETGFDRYIQTVHGSGYRFSKQLDS
jgi:two-component system, OmpR family, phosphate regulon response regulator PhoB